MKISSVFIDSFKSGFIAGLPVAVTFMTSFLAVGTFLADAGLNMAQSLVMTISTFASPSQYVVADAIKHGATLPILLIAIVTVNARFFVMAAALVQPFQKTSILQIMMGIPLLTATTFAVTVSEKEKTKTDVFYFFLGVGIIGLIAAVAATYLGHKLHNSIDSQSTKTFAMILPLYFAAQMSVESKDNLKLGIFLFGTFSALILGHFLSGGALIVLGAVIGGALGVFIKRRFA